MTRPPLSGILRLDSDQKIAYHYTRTRQDGKTVSYRKVLFGIDGDRVYIRDPETKEDVLVGRFAQATEGVLFLIFM